MKKNLFMFLFFSDFYNIFALDKANMNGCWLYYKNFTLLEQGDEYFRDTLKTETIAGKDYYTSAFGITIKITEEKKVFVCSLLTFDIVKIDKISEYVFLLKLKRNKKNNATIRITFIDANTFFLDLIESDFDLKTLQFPLFFGNDNLYKLIGYVK